MKPILIISEKFLSNISKLNGLNVIGFFFFPFIILGEEPRKNSGSHVYWRETKMHETIHFWQCVETLIFGFVLMYFGEYFVYRLKGLDHRSAYMAISFEREARANQSDEDYISKRKFLAWRKYLT